MLFYLNVLLTCYFSSIKFYFIFDRNYGSSSLIPKKQYIRVSQKEHCPK